MLTDELKDFDDIGKTIQLHGNGLFSKEEVIVSINKTEKSNGIVFVLNNQRISCDIGNVSNATRNIVLSNNIESVCLVEHFLAACSLLNVDGIEVRTNKNELIFNDGSALHWHQAFLKSSFTKKSNTQELTLEKYNLPEALFLKSKDKEIVAIPHEGFKVSYFMDWDHPVLGKLWASWEKKDGVDKLLRARSFATKQENDFFCVSDRLLTLDEKGFNKKLHEPLEPVYHKILDIVGDLRLCGVNPLDINMHVIGFKSGHCMNVELAKELIMSLKAGDEAMTLLG